MVLSNSRFWKHVMEIYSIYLHDLLVHQLTTDGNHNIYKALLDDDVYHQIVLPIQVPDLSDLLRGYTYFSKNSVSNKSWNTMQHRRKLDVRILLSKSISHVHFPTVRTALDIVKS